MSAGSSPQIAATDTVRSEFDLLRTRVDNLEVKTAEAKKPWYRQLPLWISIFSLLISAGFSGYTAYEQSKEQKAEELKRRLETLRATVLQIADIRNEFIQASASPQQQNSAQFVQRSALLNTKKQVLIENAGALISGIETHVSPAILIEVAYEEGSDGKFVEAEHYYQTALQAPGLDTLTSVSVMRSLGELYMQPVTNFCDQNKGRDYYRRALERLQDRADDATLSNKALVLADWAYSEFLNHYTADGDRYLNEAQSVAERIPLQDAVIRQQALNYVSMAREYAVSTAHSKSVEPAGAKLAGDWRISYTQDPAMRGTVTFAAGPDGQSTTVTVDVFRDGNLVRKYSGPLAMERNGVMHVEWNGVQSTSSPAMPWMYVYGVSRLQLSSNGSIAGTESSLGDSTRIIRLQKLGGPEHGQTPLPEESRSTQHISGDGRSGHPVVGRNPLLVPGASRGADLRGGH
ncbi:MAG TPA: hypothetical protein VL240_14030 [Candidatus Binatia bacterium]|nr:hypothetical protein [Candidatus Binatia bacterium]